MFIWIQDKKKKGKLNIFKEHYSYKKHDTLKIFPDKDQEGPKYSCNINWKRIFYRKKKSKIYDFPNVIGKHGNLPTFIWCHAI